MDTAWLGLVDDAAALPPIELSVARAVAAHDARTAADGRDLVGSLVVRDTDLPDVRGFGGPVTVAVTGGAGQLAGPAALAGRLGLDLTAIQVTLRDLDDPVGNARRIVAATGSAVDDGSLADDVPVRVVVPATAATTAWLTAVDVLAEADLRLGLTIGSSSSAATVLEWIDAALDRERPFAVVAGAERALTGSEPDGIGFLNVLAAAGLLWDGVPDPLEALTATDPDRLLGYLPGDAVGRLAGARRWCTSVAASDVGRARDDLRSLGLV